MFEKRNSRTHAGWVSGKIIHAVLVLVISLCGRATADEQDGWQALSADAYPMKIRKVLNVYDIAPKYIASMRFEGFREGIGDALLFRASDDLNCASLSRCWYILLPSEQAEPIVTRCDFLEGSLAHHFNPDRSNFFVFDFLCSKTPMQIQVSKGQSLIAVGK